MRIECEQCRAVVEPTWTLERGQVSARCPTCGGESRVTVAIPDSSSAAAAELAGRECPKCGLRPVRGDACARCGLALERMATWIEDDVVPADVTAAWAACQAAWDDAAAHDHVASLALARAVQPWLARRYRACLRDRPGDAVAVRRLERVGKIAHAAFLASASPPVVPRFGRGSAVAVLVVLAVLAAAGLVWGLYLVRSTEPPPAPRVPANRPPSPPRPGPPALPIAPPAVPEHRIESGPPGG